MSGRRNNPLRQRGVTLVELMVALLLGLILTGGLIQIFIGNRATYAFNEGLSRVQENGRFALDTLNFRIRMAGYFGCLSAVTVQNNLTNTTALDYNFAEGIRGYEADGTAPGETVAPATSNPANSGNAGDWAPALPADLVGSVIPGSDVIVVHNVSAASHALASPFTTATEVFAAADPTDYAAGEIAIVSDCQKASIFQITAVTAPSAGLIDVRHASGGFTPGNTVAGASWGSDQEYAAGAELLRGETWVFYVGATARGPALFQRRLQTTGTTAALVAEEIVEGIDTMQVLYGVDNGLNGAVDAYVTADGVADWDDVVAVRVSLVARAPEEYGTERDLRDDYDLNGTLFDAPDDRRLRQVFTTTIAIRNRLP